MQKTGGYMTLILIKVLMAVMFMAMIYVNYLSNAMPLNNRTQQQISKDYPSYFTPPGITFSIWGIIYLLLAGVVINALFTGATQFAIQFSDLFVLLFFLTSILNMVWLFLWHYDKLLSSTLIMILYLIGLLWITFYLPNINQLTYIAFSVYTGWISIALIANITILILKYQIKLFVDHSILWYVIVMITGVTIGLSVLVTTGNLFYILVFMWAYAWIFIKHLRKTDHFLPTNLNNFNALLLMILFIGTLAVFYYQGFVYSA